MSDERKGNEPVDLKARLGLRKKLDEIEAARKERGRDDEATAAAVSHGEDALQRPPQATRRAPSSSVYDFAAATPVADIDVSTVRKRPRALFLLGIVLAVTVVLFAGYTIGKAFQMRSIANMRIANARHAHSIIFESKHPEAGGIRMNLFLDYLSTVKKFRADLMAKLKALPPGKRLPLLDDLKAFLDTTRKFRALHIEFPVRNIARNDFFFVDAIAPMVNLQDQATQINTLCDAILLDGAVLDFIAKMRRQRASDPARSRRTYWIRRDTAVAGGYATGVLALKLAQKETIKEGSREIPAQAIVPAEAGGEPGDGVLVPLRDLAIVDLGQAVRPYEDLLLERLLAVLVKRVGELSEAARAVNVKGLQKKLQEQAAKKPYFVF